LAVIHYTWLVKSDIREPLIYGAIVILLLLARLRPCAAPSPVSAIGWRKRGALKLLSMECSEYGPNGIVG
jgi:DMSO/TMAO reductase YedYZ heme-binding membrane subunit